MGYFDHVCITFITVTCPWNDANGMLSILLVADFSIIKYKLFKQVELAIN